MATVRPINNQVLIRQSKAQETSAGGIFIPTAAQEKGLEGEILAAGPGRVSDAGDLIPMTVIKLVKWLYFQSTPILSLRLMEKTI